MNTAQSKYWALLIALALHVLGVFFLLKNTVEKRAEDKLLELALEDLKKEIPKEELVKQAREEVRKMLRSGISDENQQEKQEETVQNEEESALEPNPERISIEKISAASKEALVESVSSVESEKKTAEKWKRTFYNGASSVSFNLENRYKITLPIPVYRCEEGGTVVVAIQVDQNGQVTQASIVRGQSGNASDCLLTAARDAALGSYFNADAHSPHTQKGTITYRFEAQ